MRFQLFPRNKHKKDISDLPMQRIKNMTSEEVLEEFHIVIYTPKDIKQINKGLELIREILTKNNGKLRGGKNV